MSASSVGNVINRALAQEMRDRCAALSADVAILAANGGSFESQLLLAREVERLTRARIELEREGR